MAALFGIFGAVALASDKHMMYYRALVVKAVGGFFEQNSGMQSLTREELKQRRDGRTFVTARVCKRAEKHVIENTCTHKEVDQSKLPSRRTC